MKQNSCDIVKDLLPLYVDGVLSESSKEFVEVHLDSCEECREICIQMSGKVEIPKNDKKQILEKVNNKIRNKKIFIMVMSVAITFLLVLVFYNIATIDSIIPYSEKNVKIVEDNGNLEVVGDYNGAVLSTIMYSLENEKNSTLIIGLQFEQNFYDKYLNPQSVNIMEHSLYDSEGIDSYLVNNKYKNDENGKLLNHYEENSEKIKFDSIKIYYLNEELDYKDDNNEKIIKQIMEKGKLIYEK